MILREGYGLQDITDDQEDIDDYLECHGNRETVIPSSTLIVCIDPGDTDFTDYLWIAPNDKAVRYDDRPEEWDGQTLLKVNDKYILINNEPCPAYTVVVINDEPEYKCDFAEDFQDIEDEDREILENIFESSKRIVALKNYTIMGISLC